MDKLLQYFLFHFQPGPIKFIRILIWPAFLGLLWLGAIVAHAADRYVSPSGTNNPPYINWADAATNIQWAVDVATNGDTVWVTNGNYRLTNEIWFTNSSVCTNVTLKSVNGRDVTSICGNYVAGVSPYTNRCIMISNYYITIDGFTISNGAARDTANEGRYVGAGIYSVCSNSTIRNCILRENTCLGYGGGIVMNSGGTVSNCIVEKNHVTSGWRQGGGICIGLGGSMPLTVANCIVRQNEGGGIGGTVRTIFLIIRNCVIDHNYYSSANSSYRGLGVSCGANAIVENCTIVSNYFTDSNTNNVGGGIGVTDGATNVNIRNCIVYSNWNRGGPAEYINWYAGTAVVFTACVTTPTNNLPGTGNITNNPSFVDYATTNYRLAANSPCINTGTNQDWMTNSVDLDGRMRIRYGTVDMGAYENIHEGIVYKLR